MAKKEEKKPSLKYDNLENLLDTIKAVALEQAYERIISGKASDGLLQMFLKGLLPETQVAVEEKKKNLQLADAKINKLTAETTSEESFQKAIAAFAKYSGHPEEELIDE